jgi:hypothetical protein
MSRIRQGALGYLRCLLIILVIVLVAGVLTSFSYLFKAAAIGTNFTPRTLTVSSSVPGATANYMFGINYTTATSVGSVKFEFCANDPFIGTACTAPSGLDISSATIINQTGETGFSVHPSTTANSLVLTRVPVVATQPSTYELSPVTNPSNAGTYYVRAQTFASTDASGPDIEEGGLAFSINAPLNVSAEVPPYLEFCSGIVITGFDCSTVSGSSSGFGELSKTATKTATSQFMAGTNAQFGYSVTMVGTTMTSGNDVINAMSGSASVPGISQFGLNLRANTIPSTGQEPAGSGSAVASTDYNQPNIFRFNSGDIIVVATGSTDFQKFTASYIVNVSSQQPPGRYVTTISYICLASF